MKFWLVWPAVLLIYLLSIYPVSSRLLSSLERYPVLHQDSQGDLTDQVVVVLGGGRPQASPEMPGLRPSMYTLERLRYGAWLSKHHQLPVLVSGGSAYAEAGTMARSLFQDFGVRAEWLEDRSRTTWENAVFSRELLPDTIDTVVLVTHAWHMPRAVLSFERAGFQVIPAPTALTPKPRSHFRLSHWLPQGQHLAVSERAIREYMGYCWYWLAYSHRL